jgi:hypothetical protein
MLQSIRRIVVCAVLLAGLGVMAPTAARADVDMTNYNTYWQVAQDPTPPSTNLNYNTYWAEVQAQQQSGPQS